MTIKSKFKLAHVACVCSTATALVLLSIAYGFFSIPTLGWFALSSAGGAYFCNLSKRLVEKAGVQSLLDIAMEIEE